MEKPKSKINLKCWMSLNTWAKIMALSNLIIGISIIIGGSVWLAKAHVPPMQNVTHEAMHDATNNATRNAIDDYNAMKTYCIIGIGVGILSIVSGCILVTAIVQGKDHSVLLYLLLEFIIVFILTIFTGMHAAGEFSLVMLGLFCLCPILWIGLYNVYGFYTELYNYNNDSVQAGVDQIICNTHTNPLVPFPEKAVDTTTV